MKFVLSFATLMALACPSPVELLAATRSVTVRAKYGFLYCKKTSRSADCEKTSDRFESRPQLYELETVTDPDGLGFKTFTLNYGEVTAKIYITVFTENTSLSIDFSGEGINGDEKHVSSIQIYPGTFEELNSFGVGSHKGFYSDGYWIYPYIHILSASSQQARSK